LVAAVTVVLLASSLATANGPRPPNILLILADDMGWTDAGFAGSDLYRTPHLDQFTTESVRFTNSYAACHVCSPTRASIMTGKSPARLHLTDFIPGGRDHGMQSPDWTKFLPLEEFTIAEALSDAGYQCGHFGKWHLNRDKDYRPGRPMDPGSQGFHEVLTTRKPSRNADPTNDPHHVREITDAALEFIQAHHNEPFFCYVTHNALHTPVIGHPDVVPTFAKSASSATKHTNAAYAAMAHDLDRSTGRLLSQLDELNITQQTIVIFTSDNGGLVSSRSGRGPTSNYPLRAGKGTNYEGGVRVPTLIRWPGVTQSGTKCHEPVISHDLYPTLLEMTDTKGNAAHNKNVEGLSIVPLLHNASATLDRDALYWHYPHYHSAGATPHGAIRSGQWKLIEFFEDQHVELYDIVADISESQELSNMHPEVATQLHQRLNRWRHSVSAQMPVLVNAE